MKKIKLFTQLSPEEKNKASALINYNESEEALARRDYYELLNYIADEDKEKIRGIIQDEINHSIILMQLAEKYSMNLPSEFKNINSLEKQK